MGVTVQEDGPKKIIISFPYDSALAAKAKTIPGHRWNFDKKQWGFPNTNGTLEKILKAFEGEKIHLDPAVKGSENISSPQKGKGIIKVPSPLAGEGRVRGILKPFAENSSPVF